MPLLLLRQQMVLESLAGRKFPLEPPKGKGNKVADATGTLGAAMAELPDIARR